jgi:hypothetical protein
LGNTELSSTQQVAASELELHSSQRAQSMMIKWKTKQSMTKITKCIKGLETSEIKHYFSLLMHGRSLSIFIYFFNFNFNNSSVLSTPRNHNFIKQDSKAHI